VPFSAPPKTAADRLKVLMHMQAHSQYCMSGDFTVEATRAALTQLVNEPADDYFLFLFSDANFRRYGIDPSAFGQLLSSDPRVTCSAFFIASLNDEAQVIASRFPRQAQVYVRCLFCGFTERKRE
jgi:hypothetical protein